MLRFRRIRRRIPWGSQMLFFTMNLALFPGIGDPFFSQTLKKPKENQCVWLRTLKNLRKINVFALPEHLVTLGAPLGSPRPKNYWRRSAPSPTWAEDEVTKVWYPDMIKFAVKFGKLRTKKRILYIHKLPIHRKAATMLSDISMTHGFLGWCLKNKTKKSRKKSACGQQPRQRKPYK